MDSKFSGTPHEPWILVFENDEGGIVYTLKKHILKHIILKGYIKVHMTKASGHKPGVYLLETVKEACSTLAKTYSKSQTNDSIKSTWEIGNHVARGVRHDSK